MRIRLPFMGALVHADAKVKAHQGECDKGTKEFAVESSSPANRLTVPSSLNRIFKRYQEPPLSGMGTPSRSFRLLVCGCPVSIAASR